MYSISFAAWLPFSAMAFVVVFAGLQLLVDCLAMAFTRGARSRLRKTVWQVRDHKIRDLADLRRLFVLAGYSSKPFDKFFACRHLPQRWDHVNDSLDDDQPLTVHLTAFVAKVAPLLGMLFTFIGMGFALGELSNDVNGTARLSGNIALALLTSMAGIVLTVAALGVRGGLLWAHENCACDYRELLIHLDSVVAPDREIPQPCGEHKVDTLTQKTTPPHRAGVSRAWPGRGHCSSAKSLGFFPNNRLRQLKGRNS